MKRHPREIIVGRADTKIHQLFLSLEQEHDLGYADLFRLIGAVHRETVGRLAQDGGYEDPVDDAEVELRESFWSIVDESELTSGEIFRILSSVQASLAKSLIRDERHPGEPDKPGGLE